MAENTAIIQAFIDAFQRGDSEHAMSLLAEDVEMVEPASLPYGGIWKGVAQVEALNVKLAELWEYTGFECTVYATDQDSTFHAGTITGTARATGRECAMGFVEKTEYEGDKIRRVTVYPTDTAAILYALGELDEEPRGRTSAAA